MENLGKKIAVVGAGLAGATVAYELNKRGYEVTVFEKSPEVGGRAQTYVAGGFVVNKGASFFTNNLYPNFRRLVGELGLEGCVVSQEKAVYFADGAGQLYFAPSTLRTILSFVPMGVWEKVRYGVSLVRWRGRRVGLSLSSPEMLARYDHESLADFGRAELGGNDWRFLMCAPLEASWFFDAEEVSSAVGKVVHSHLVGMKLHTLAGGMAQVVRGLLVGVDVRVGEGVLGVAVVDSGRVTIHLENSEEIGFDAVVVACPAVAASKIVGCVGSPWVSVFQQQFLREQGYLTHVNVTLLLAGCLPDQTIIPVVPGRDISSMTIENTNGQTTATIYLREACSKRLLGQMPKVIAREAWRLAREYQPELPEWKRILTIASYAEGIPLHEPRRYDAVVRFLAEETHPIYFAGDYLATATLEGAVSSGLQVVERMSHHL